MTVASQSSTPGAPAEPPATTVLVVDDSLVDRHVAAGLIEEALGWRAAHAADGRAALEEVARREPDLVLTDLQMPGMNGLELVDALRERHPQVPVVLMTAHGSEAIAMQALRQGAASYVPKYRLAADLVATLEQVLDSARATARDERVKGCVTRLDVSYELPNDMAVVRGLVAAVQRGLADLKVGRPASRTQVGIALHEALTNALFHGNLELDSRLREGHKDEYWALADERRRQVPYRDRPIEVRARLTRGEALFEVRDRGPGFDTTALPDPTDPANLEKPTGRGMLLIRTFMDRVEFNEVGNAITLVKFWEPAAGGGDGQPRGSTH